MKKQFLLVAFISLSPLLLCAQHQSSYNLFHINRYIYNPAVAGSNPYIFVSSSYTKYWSGIEGSPTMQTSNGHTLLSEQTAAGIKIFNETTGLSKNSGAELTYAYHIPLSSGGTKLSLGLSGVIQQYALSKDKFVLHNTDDEALKYLESSIIKPGANAGISIYQENKFYIDIAVSQLFGSKVDFLNEAYIENKQLRHYYVGLGYIFPINETIRLEPSVLAKFTETADWQVEAGLKAEILKKFVAGCYYRTNDAVVPFVGINTLNLTFAYAYGVTINQLSAYTTGTHEIMLIIKILNAKSSL